MRDDVSPPKNRNIYRNLFRCLKRANPVLKMSSAPSQDIDMSTTTSSNESNLQENPTAFLLPLKRKRDDDIQGPEIYTIFINQFIDILADSPQEETIRPYHSLFHVNKATQRTFLTSSSLTAKREQFEFAKCLEGLVSECHLTLVCPETQQSYVFRFEPPQGIILHFRSRYCKILSPEDVAPFFNAMMLSGPTPKDQPLCSLEDFRQIWRSLARKVKQWPDEFILHERHMGSHYNGYSNQESDEMYKRMGYTDLDDPAPVSTRQALQVGEVLTRIENWKKREEERALTRMEEIENKSKMENEPSEDEIIDIDENEVEDMEVEMGEVVIAMDEISKEKSTPLIKREHRPAKLRRSPRLLART